MAERTLAIIKPDALAAGNSGAIIQLIELNKFAILRMEKTELTLNQAEVFYAVHKEKPFFGELVSHMVSGPVILMVLEKQDAIREWREFMGATNPEKAGPGTLRRMFAASIGSNAVHGSDSNDTAKQEIKLFFPDLA